MDVSTFWREVSEFFFCVHYVSSTREPSSDGICFKCALRSLLITAEFNWHELIAFIKLTSELWLGVRGSFAITWNCSRAVEFRLIRLTI